VSDTVTMQYHSTHGVQMIILRTGRYTVSTIGTAPKLRFPVSRQWYMISSSRSIKNLRCNPKEYIMNGEYKTANLSTPPSNQHHYTPLPRSN